MYVWGDGLADEGKNEKFEMGETCSEDGGQKNTE